MAEPSPPSSTPSGRTIALQAAAPNAAAASQRRAEVHGPWRPATLLASPHRLGFFLAAMVLILASLWWLAVQVDRSTGALGLASAVPATLTHAVVMVFGFMPLYFSGFLFTAGPKWLNVPPYQAAQLRAPLG